MLCVHVQVLREGASQEDTYKAVVQGTIQDTLQGINATVLAYGQTGALFALRHSRSCRCMHAFRFFTPQLCQVLGRRTAFLETSAQKVWKASCRALYTS